MSSIFTLYNFSTFFGFVLFSVLLWFFLPLIHVYDTHPFISIYIRSAVIACVALMWILKTIIVFYFIRRVDKKVLRFLVKNNVPKIDKTGVGSKTKRLIKNLDLHLSNLVGKNKYISELPWYMVIGAPASGKTSLIVNSGLTKPIELFFDENKQQNGNGNATNCNCWLMDSGFFVDVSRFEKNQDLLTGSWNTPVNDVAWLSLLKSLKKHKGKKAISGLIITVDVSVILKGDKEKFQQMMSAGKQRIFDVCKVFNTIIPVYIMLTKADHLSGFSEFFTDFSESQLEQTWGVIFPFDKKTDAVSLFDTRYEELITRLNAQLCVKLRNTSDVVQRASLSLFPMQVKLLKQVLQDYLKELLISPQLRERILLRGIFFSSSLQQSELHEHPIIETLSTRFGFSIIDKSANQTKNKVYFLKDFFEKFLAQENTVLKNYARNLHHTYYKNLDRLRYAAVGLFLVASISTMWLSTKKNNANAKLMASYLGQHSVEEKKFNEKKNHKIVDTLPTLNSLTKAMNVYDEDEDEYSWLLHFELYQNDKLGPAAERALTRELHRIFVPHVLSTLDLIIDEAGIKEARYRDLLFQAYAKSDNKTMLSANIINLLMHDYWQIKYKGNPKLQKELNYYLSFSLKKFLVNKDFNQKLLRWVNKKLGNISLPTLAYEIIKNQADIYYPQQFDVTQQLGAEARDVFSRTIVIPMLYTKKGYNDFFKENVQLISQKLSNDGVNIGLIAMRDGEIKYTKQRLQSKVMELYRHDYQKHWRNVLNDAKLQKFSDINQAISILGYLGENDFILKKLINIALSNTDIKIDDKSLQTPFSSLQELVSKDKGGASISQLEAKISSLQAFLIQLRQTPNPKKEAYTVVKELMAGVTKKGQSLKAFEKFQTNNLYPLDALLQNIYQNTLQVLFSDAKKYLRKKWGTKVVEAFNGNLKNFYPINPKSSVQLELARFINFFSYQGVANKFVKTYMQPFIDTSKSPWRNIMYANTSMRFQPALLKELEQINTINNTYFNPNNKQLELHFSLKPLILDDRLKSVRLEIGKQSILYKHGPQQSYNFAWTEKNDLQSIRVTMFDFNNKIHVKTIDGDWALFKLFNLAKIKKAKQGRNHYNFTVNISGYKASFQLVAQNGLNAFNLSLLSGLQIKGLS